MFTSRGALGFMRFNRFFSTATTALMVRPDHFTDTTNRILTISPQYYPRAVNFDIAGTLVDDGCIAPYIALRNKFAEYQLPLTHQQLTDPMGLEKRKHIELLVNELKKAGMKFQGREMSADVVDQIHREFVPYLNSILQTGKYNALTPHADQFLDFLKSRKIKWGLTSGYARHSAEYAADKLLKAHQPDAFTASDQVVVKKRIEMIYKNLLCIGIDLSQISKTLFFTDAINDVVDVMEAEEHPFVIAVTGTSTHMKKTGLPEDQLHYDQQNKNVVGLFNSLPPRLRPHYTIDHMGHAPDVFLAVALALQQGFNALTISNLERFIAVEGVGGIRPQKVFY
jgi:beta-phosphoglucomutase-like phosphatase (HAD superfamily)